VVSYKELKDGNIFGV